MGQGQTRASAEEQRLREVSQQMQRGERVPPFSDDIFFVTGDYPQPLRGRAALREASEARRARQRNISRTFTIERLVVAEAGDLAYENGTLHQEWDTPEGEHRAVDAAYLAAWRKHDGEWQLEAVVSHGVASGPWTS
jgi:ketosteroid isomerase-like protein